MKTALQAFEKELDAIREAGTWREERIITTPQRSCIDTVQKKHVEMMGFLGMGNNPMVGATVAVAVAVDEALNK